MLEFLKTTAVGALVLAIFVGIFSGIKYIGACIGLEGRLFAIGVLLGLALAFGVGRIVLLTLEDE